MVWGTRATCHSPTTSSKWRLRDGRLGVHEQNDGTDGLQPRFTSVVRNFVREIGPIEKQSSMFQAKSCRASSRPPIIFNGRVRP